MANNQQHDIQSVTELVFLIYILSFSILLSYFRKTNNELRSNLQTIDSNSKSPDINREDFKDEASANKSESTQSSDAQIDGISTQKHPVQNHSLTENDSDKSRQRTLSSSSSTSSSSSSSDNQTSNIPYEILNNDEDDDDDDDHLSN